MSHTDENKTVENGEVKSPDLPKFILSQMGGASPLDSVRKNVQNTVDRGKKEIAEAEEKAAAAKMAEEVKATKTKKSEEKPAAAPRKKTSSLLAKCMPYIYDDHTNTYPEEKPDYTLESVEDIIESAEKRASEKIARMYNLKASEVQNIGNPSPTPEAPEKEERPKLQKASENRRHGSQRR